MECGIAMNDKLGPWTFYEPAGGDAWDLAKVAHLHRRAGFGGTRAELQRDLKDGPEASVERFFRAPPPSADEMQVLDSLRKGVLDSRDPERLKAWWLYRMLSTADPLREKMTLFWHGHFATSNRKVENLAFMLRQNETFRKHALAPFAQLLEAVCDDPAMLVWLDGIDSKKEKPNENFAREFLELFTLGVGNYTEKDIREAARAFTGWVRGGGGGRRSPDEDFQRDPGRADAGDKTFFGQTGAWKAADVVRLTLERPEAAEFLCRKLYRFFVGELEEPAAELIRPLAAELRSHEYSLEHVLKVLLRSRHFYSAAVRRQRIKGPVEYSVGLIRCLEKPRADWGLLPLAVACERQGQDLFYPPNVKGWDGGKTWLNSTTVLERGNWGNDIVWGNPDLGLRPYDPLAWANRYDLAPERATAAFLELLLQDDLSAKARESIRKVSADGTADGLRKAIQQILHCPEFQLV
jgi:uncharacterized protein (DUF1800 family)